MRQPSPVRNSNLVGTTSVSFHPMSTILYLRPAAQYSILGTKTKLLKIEANDVS